MKHEGIYERMKWGVYEADNGSVHVCATTHADRGSHFLDELCFCEPVFDDGVWIII